MADPMLKKKSAWYIQCTTVDYLPSTKLDYAVSISLEFREAVQQISMKSLRNYQCVCVF